MKNHADAAPEPECIHWITQQVLAIKQDLPLDLRTLVLIGESIKGGEKTGLATAGWADQRGNAALVDIQRYLG